jgi:hypothetical protein
MDGKSRARFSVIAGFTRIHAAIDREGVGGMTLIWLRPPCAVQPRASPLPQGEGGGRADHRRRYPATREYARL